MKSKLQFPTQTPNFQPMNDMVLLRPIVEEKIGLIIIPDNARGKAMEATVIAAGPGNRYPNSATREPMEVKPGDHVFVRYYHEALIEVRGETLAMLPERDIVGVLDMDEMDEPVPVTCFVGNT